MHSVVWHMDDDSEVDVMMSAMREWREENPHASLSCILNPELLMLNGKEVFRISHQRGGTNVTFVMLFDDASAAMLFKLRYFKNGQTSSKEEGI
jgi:hypothetical protein